MDTSAHHKFKGNFANKILRGELSAIEAYEAAIARLEDSNDAPIAVLRELCEDHATSAHQVEQVVKEENVLASEDSGWWGNFVRTLVSTAGLIGENSVLLTLRKGEARGLRQYEAALKLPLEPWEKKMIQNVLIPKQHQHLFKIDLLLRHG
jgi:hypothetical protein